MVMLHAAAAHAPSAAHADPLLGGSAKKSAFSNSAYLVELQGGGGGGGVY